MKKKLKKVELKKNDKTKSFHLSKRVFFGCGYLKIFENIINDVLTPKCFFESLLSYHLNTTQNEY